MVQGTEPDLDSLCLPVPEHVEELILLGDGDSEPVMTRAALKRGCKRHARELAIPSSAWRRWNDCAIDTASGASWPSASGKDGSVRIRYRAGYDGAEGRGVVPERARQAVILGVRALMGLIEQRMLRSSQVEGVGTRSFVGADIASAALRTASDRLLSTLRVYA